VLKKVLLYYDTWTRPESAPEQAPIFIALCGTSQMTLWDKLQNLGFFVEPASISGRPTLRDGR
jgi:hypothetical protein